MPAGIDGGVALTAELSGCPPRAAVPCTGRAAASPVGRGGVSCRLYFGGMA